MNRVHAPAPATRRLAASEVVAAVGVAALGVGALLPVDHIEDGPIICPFRRLTGLPCPGCGLTRSWTYLMHGWWRDAFLAHPFGLLLALVIVAVGAVAIRARLRGTPAPSLDRLVRQPLSIAVLVAWLGWALVRAILAI